MSRYEILDQVPSLIEVAVVIARRFAVGFWRDHCGFARRRQLLDHPLIGVEPLVANERVGLHVGQEVVGARQVVRLPAG